MKKNGEFSQLDRALWWFGLLSMIAGGMILAMDLATWWVDAPIARPVNPGTATVTITVGLIALKLAKKA